jgi:predicted phage baseplate assembly protein
VENVTSEYRIGLGLEGELEEDRLSMMATPVLGVREVTNPVPASGGQDPEKREDARENAPVTVRTLDRIVSLTDFEDFARTFSGIGKVWAGWLWDGSRRIVQVTVGSAGGKEIAEDSTLLSALRTAMDEHRDTNQPLVIGSFQQRLFTLEAKIKVDSDYLFSAVAPEIEQLLQTSFSFKKRRFAQGVTRSEVLSVIHSVAGVKAVDIDALDFFPPPSGEADLHSRLVALPARLGIDHLGDQVILGAELLTLRPGPVELAEMT